MTDSNLKEENKEMKIWCISSYPWEKWWDDYIGETFLWLKIILCIILDELEWKEYAEDVEITQNGKRE